MSAYFRWFSSLLLALLIAVLASTPAHSATPSKQAGPAATMGRLWR